MDGRLLKIQMFNEFTLGFGEKVLLTAKARKNKPLYLLQYLIAHREKEFSRDSLIQLLYENEETDDPANAFKIIIHRLRKLLSKSGLKDQDYIIYEKGKYGWNEKIPCKIDTEVFETAINFAKEKKVSEDEKLELYLKAIDIYSGEFLSDLQTEDWAASLSLHYQNLYHFAVHSAYQMLEENEDYKRMMNVADRAALLFPYDEGVQILKINSLYKNNHIKQALSAYEATVEMLFNEFGVSPSVELLRTYSEITKGNIEDSKTIVDIRDSIIERDDDDGAYYSNFQNFADIYHLVVRNVERTGLSAYLMLCTLDNKEDFGHLRKSIKESLRKGDSFSRYSKDQYMILLLGISYEMCEAVFKRIEDRFRKLCGGRCSNLKHTVISAVDPQWINEKTV